MTLNRGFATGVTFIVTAFLLLSPSCRTWSTREQRAAISFNKGNELRESGRLEEAAEAYRTALSFQDNLASASYNLALTQSELGLYEEAMFHLESLRTADPENLKIIRAMAWVARSAGDIREALGFYRSALDIFPGHIPSLEGMSEVLEKSGRAAEAVPYREFLVRLEDSTASRLNLGTTLSAIGRDKEALQVYREILSTDPLDSDALSGAAMASEEIGAARESLTYQLALAESRGYPEDWWNVARLRISATGEYEGAVRALEKAVEGGFQDETAFKDLIASTPPEIRPAVRNLIGGD